MTFIPLKIWRSLFTTCAESIPLPAFRSSSLRKAVSEPVAVGVAKAGADGILISGHDGGTGAAPLSAVRHCGSPWELGLAEAHRALLASGLRDRIRLQTDGGLHSGRDIVIAAILGADEFGFGTALLVSSGCIMCRKCHEGRCPAGIATQDRELRRRFAGKPAHVLNYLRFVAEDVRRHLAALGLPDLASARDRIDLLTPRSATRQTRTAGLDGTARPPPAFPARTVRRKRNKHSFRAGSGYARRLF